MHFYLLRIFHCFFSLQTHKSRQHIILRLLFHVNKIEAFMSKSTTFFFSLHYLNYCTEQILLWQLAGLCCWLSSSGYFTSSALTTCCGHVSKRRQRTRRRVKNKNKEKKSHRSTVRKREVIGTNEQEEQSWWSRQCIQLAVLQAVILLEDRMSLLGKSHSLHNKS